jgi:hypothetical protein
MATVTGSLRLLKVAVAYHSVLETPDGYLGKGASMNKKILITAVLFVILLSGCSPSEADIQAAIAQTEAARSTDTATPEPTNTPTHTPQPTYTLTPTATNTPRPTLTPSPTIQLPDVVKDTLDNPEVIHWEDFDSELIGSSPFSWTGNPNMPKVTYDLSLGLRGQTVGFYYGETINPNQAVLTRFMFGSNPSFTIGFYVAKGRELIPSRQPGSRVLNLASRFTPMVTNYIDGEGTTYYFDRQVELEMDHWYMVMIGFTKDQTYFIKVWDPENPELVLSFKEQLANMPSSYTFVYWAGERSEISIDDFSILNFSSLRAADMQTAIAQTEATSPTNTATPEPIITPTQTPTAVPTTTAVPIPTSFSNYHSAEVVAEHGLDVIPFSVSYPTGWVTGWGQDSGVNYFLIMSDSNAGKHSSAVMATILLAQSDDFDYQEYKETFTGLTGEMIGETMLNDLRLVETVSTNRFDQGEVLHISTIIEGDKPTEGLIVEAKMPRSSEALYRPFLEQIISSIAITNKVKSAVITAEPDTVSIPATHTFTLSKFHPNESVLVIFYFEPTGRNYFSYKTTLTVDENGNGELIVNSEETNPEGENWFGEYLVKAIGYEGSYAEVLMTYK